MTDTTVADAPATQLVDSYFDLWRTTDDAARAELVAQVFTTDGRHVDPLMDANGHADLLAMMANVHAHYPGFAIERTTGIDQHGDQLRFGWQLDAADGTTVVTGIDVAEVAADGRLAKVAGFWGELPER